jgi:hypothetical protein
MCKSTRSETRERRFKSGLAGRAGMMVEFQQL